MKLHFLTVIFTFVAVLCEGQRLSESYVPLIKETPQNLFITQCPDGNYLVYGDIHYYGNSFCGSIVKVNPAGERVEGFGVVSADLPISHAVILPSGDILIQGSFRYVNGVRTGRLALLHADGSLDASFKVDPALQISDFGVQSTGKIIVFSNAPVSRLNTDGSVDATFTTEASLSYGSAGLVAANDEIYVVVYSSIYRLEPDGKMDDTYMFPAIANSHIGPLVLQPDRKIAALVTATDPNPPFNQITTIRRFNSDGTVDDSFSAGNANGISSLALRKNGKFVFTGNLTAFEGVEGNAFEINADGSFSRVVLTTDFNGMYAAYEDQDENIFVTGGFRKINHLLNMPYIAKIQADYQIDGSFKVPVSRTPQDFYLTMAAQSTGKLIFGGGYFFSGLADHSSKLVRTFPDGTIDPSFQPQIRNDEVNSINPSITAVAVQDDDRIVVGGSNLFSGASAALNRLLPDGAVDGSFHVGTGVARSNGWSPWVSEIRIWKSHIYVLGSFDRYDGEVCQYLVILDKDGNKIGPEQNVLPESSYFQDMELQSDGKIVLLGTFPLSDTDNRKFIRLNQDGSIDDSFQLKNVDGNLNDFAIYNSDSILIVGNYLDFVSKRVLVRYGPNGELAERLEQGSGFASAGDDSFVSGSFVQPVASGLIAVGGAFSGYDGTVSPGLILLQPNGSAIPFPNPFDSTAIAMAGTYSAGALYVAGMFSSGHGQSVSGGVKMVFPIEAKVADYTVKGMSDSSIAVTWSGNYDGAEKITVERSSPDDAHYEVIASLSPGAQSFEATGLSELTSYYVRITGSNEFYTSDSFTGHDTTLMSPQTVLAPTEVTPESFVANWQYLPGTDSCMLQVSSDNFLTFLPGYEKLIVTTSSSIVEGLKSGETYEYRVMRFRNGKGSPFSEVMTVNLISGTEDILAGIRVFPNPVRDHILIDLAQNSGATTATIQSLTGELVSTTCISGQGPFELNIGDLKPGIFVLTISMRDKRLNLRFIKLE